MLRHTAVHFTVVTYFPFFRHDMNELTSRNGCFSFYFGSIQDVNIRMLNPRKSASARFVLLKYPLPHNYMQIKFQYKALNVTIELLN